MKGKKKATKLFTAKTKRNFFHPNTNIPSIRSAFNSLENNVVFGSAIADKRISEFFLVFSVVLIADTRSDNEFILIAFEYELKLTEVNL